MAALRSLWESLAEAGRGSRSVWVGNGRAYVAVRGLDGADGSVLTSDLTSRLEKLPGVAWAEVNHARGRVVVQFRSLPEADLTLEAALGVVEEAEAAHGLQRHHFGAHLGDPADSRLVERAFGGIIADMAGLAVSSVGTAIEDLAPIPPEIVSLVSFLDAEPHLRRLLARLIGPSSADLTAAVASAAAHGLAHRRAGLAVDLCYRVALVAEASAQARAWRDGERHWANSRSRCRTVPISVAPRPTPLPRGPIETYTSRASIAALGGSVASLLTSSDHRRAAALLYAGVPKAAKLGREAFASELGRRMAAGGMVALESSALRRLDRVDTVLIDQRLAQLVGRQVMAEIVGAARQAGHMLVWSGTKASSAPWQPDLVFPPKRDLAEQVRSLQLDGCVVAVVSGADNEALAAADVGITATRTRGRIGWAADLVVPPAELWRIVEASGTAREVSRQSAALALLGAAAASTAAIGASDAREATSRAGMVVNALAAVSLANGMRAAVSVTLRQPPAPPEQTVPWHALASADVLTGVESSSDGLAWPQARKRADPRTQLPPWPLRLAAAVLEELENPLTPVLAAGMTLSASLGGALDAGIVAAVTAANALMGGAQRFRAAGEVAHLAMVSDVPARVRRGGTTCEIPASQVVVGDIVLLSAGDSLPADIRLLSDSSMLVDQSSLTGESDLVEKSSHPCHAELVAERSSMIYEGSSVAAGEGWGVVVATGMRTEAGRAASVPGRPSGGGVEERLAELTSKAVPLAGIGGLAAIAAGLVHRRPVAESLATGVTLAVAAVPEGLPLVATMAQLAAAKRLAHEGALVRNPRAIEALGRVEVVCTDKTGTLTAGKIALRLIDDGQARYDALDPGAGSHILAAALRATPDPQAEPLAHPTDSAVAAGGVAAKVGPEHGLPSWKRIAELPFEPSQGFHATLGSSKGRRVLSVKGAPEAILLRCTTWRAADMPTGKPISAELAAELMDRVDGLARKAMRILAVAERIEPHQAGRVHQRGAPPEEAINQLELVGFLALSDPVRPEAAEALAGLADAGISVVMITGDHPSTAEGIAAELGILNSHRILTGPEMADMADDDLDEVVESVSVFARVTPSDKVRIVASLQRRGRAVAMTGDGANDASAIRLADVGVAMGSKATPAAREAADLVITNDDITVLIRAVFEGRALWRSVREALAMLLGGNLGEIGFTVAGSLFGQGAPLSPRQLLVVNLLTDVAPALAIATRPPGAYTGADLLSEGPERSLGRPLEAAILARGTITATAAGGAWLAARATGGADRASTTALVALVGAQLGQTFTSGARNPTVIAASAGSAALLAAVVQTPGLNSLFGCVALDPAAWMIAAGAAGAATVGAVVIPLAGTSAQKVAGVFKVTTMGPAVSHAPPGPGGDH